MVLRIFIFSSFAFLFCFNTYLPAQTYNIQKYTLEDGLLQSEILAICQDRDGNMWFGTYGGGVCKYDGVSFKKVALLEGLIGYVITSIFEDSQGNIWIASNRSITRFNGQQFINFSEKDGPHYASIMSVVEDADSNIWFASGKSGFIKFSEDGNKVFTKNNGLPINKGMTGVLASNNKLWFGTYGEGIYEVIGDTVKNYRVEDGLAGNRVFIMISDSKGNLWIGTGNGVSKLERKYLDKDVRKFKNFRVEDGLPHNLVRGLQEDHKGNIWIGTNGGLCKYDGNNFITINEDNGLTHNRVRCIYEDRENNLWVGTNGGVSKLLNMNFVNISANDGLINNTVNSIVEDEQGNLWVATMRGLSKISFENNQLSGLKIKNYTIDDGLCGNVIWSLLKDKNNDIWLATNREYACRISDHEFKNGKLSIRNYDAEDGLTYSIVWSLTEDHQGKIWFGTNSGLYAYDKNSTDVKKIKGYYKKDGLAYNIVWSTFEDTRHHVWIGTAGGLTKFDGFKFIDYTHIKGLENHSIYAITEDKDGNMWFGTYGAGLVSLKFDADKRGLDTTQRSPKQESWYIINTENGLSHNAVVSLIVDDLNNLWIGTLQGINKLDLNAFKKSKKIDITHFGKNEGLKGIECQHNAFCKDNYGNIWIGTVKGLYKYEHEQDAKNYAPPKTYINRLRLFFKETDLSSYADSINANNGLPLGLELPYDQNHLTFDFIGLSLTIPEKVRYRYKLEGLDKEWSPEVRERFATYSSIPPGDYVFKLVACNNDGIWNSIPLSYEFTVASPFWKTSWFYTIMSILVFGSIYVIYKIRVNHLKRSERILKERVSIKTYQLEQEKDKFEQINKVIAEKNKSITDSIQYARHIQEALYPRKEFVNEFIPDSFGLYKPKEIVSGDFAWFAKKDNRIFIAAVDCTGHGVPGAFLSVLGNTLLNNIVMEREIYEPDQILAEMNTEVAKTLH
ncbi:SpoIIE family protein phosphatase, partial [Candidatus Amoebophilus asiaticus]|nr:SpoIIE family protein phosphatase [Candidatus Amoebophilus asiaticus]